MKVPYLGRRMSEEFGVYVSELQAHVESCASDASIRAAASQLYRQLFPLFLFIREFSSCDFGEDPTRDLLLARMQSSGDKEGFVETLRMPQVKGLLREELQRGIKERSFTFYLGELWSDALLCLNSLTTCNYRGAHIALRCMLEDLYRHLYYKDHPEEFGMLRFDPTAEDKFEVSPAEFREYLKKVEYLQVFHELDLSFRGKLEASDGDLFWLNNELYAKCSSYVHGVKLGEINSFRTNSNAVRGARKESELLVTTKKFVKLAVAFLVAAHSEEFRKFNEFDKSIVLEALALDEKHNLRKSLNF